MNETVTIKGTGLLRVSDALWPVLGSPDTMEAWHKALLLPDNYEVTHVTHANYGDVRGACFELYVCSDEIPPVTPEHIRIPDIKPYYSAQYDEQSNCTGMKLNYIDVYQWKVEE